MKQTLVVVAGFCLIAALLSMVACDAPGRPSADSQELSPSAVTDFDKLYASNCAGCHGPDGKTGPPSRLRIPYIYDRR